MNNIYGKDKELNINEERIQNLLKFRKKNLNQKLFRARLRKFDYSNLNKNNDNTIKTIKENINTDINIIININKDNININEENLIFKEDDYLIDPDDLKINEKIKQMDFVETENIINNIIILLTEKDLNSILYGLLMMRKFAVIDAILINKSELFIEKKMYIQICNLLHDYCTINKKLVFESLWILSNFVYDSQDKEIYHFLLTNKCIDLYKKILLYNNNSKLDLDVFLEEICTLLLNLLIYKEKEYDNNIINYELDENNLIQFLKEIVDIIINMKRIKEIYISFFIEITNSFDLYKLLQYDLLNKIMIFLIEENFKKLNEEINYDEDIDMYYEKYNEIGNYYKSKIKNIYQISLIQLQYLLMHPLKEMPFNCIQKLSNEIISKMNKYLNDKKNNLFYVGYINSYISYIAELNIIISYEETKNLFEYLITNIKNKNNNTQIIIECIIGLNNLSLKMILNKMFGLLITELPNILLFIKNDNNNINRISIKALNEISPNEYQIIISSHSPLLQSDIPVNCCNYLKTVGDKTSNVRESHTQTFASNVFELYRDSFFLEEGLIGEFAKKRIKSLENNINDNFESIDDIESEINLIGDERLRLYFYDLLSKSKKGKMAAIKFYEEQIKRLKEDKQ